MSNDKTASKDRGDFRAAKIYRPFDPDTRSTKSQIIFVYFLDAQSYNYNLIDLKMLSYYLGL